MRSTVTAVLATVALLGCAADVYAWAGGPRHGGGDGPGTGYSYSNNGPTSSVPEPSTLYAIGSGIALLGGAGWYIRRRK